MDDVEVISATTTDLRARALAVSSKLVVKFGVKTKSMDAAGQIESVLQNRASWSSVFVDSLNQGRRHKQAIAKEPSNQH